jgi:hypothetical protein
MQTENDMYTREIPRLSTNNTSRYQVKAMNMESEVKRSAGVNISPRISVHEPMIIQSNGYPPEFLQLFTDRKALIGSTIKFEARVNGTQPLNVNSFL